MARQINPYAKECISDKDWLYEQHVTNLYGIVAIAKKLNVTPNVVRKAIRSFNIVSPSQQELREASNFRTHGVKNPGQLPDVRGKALKTMTERYGGHNFSHDAAGKRNIRDTTCLKKYGNKNPAKTTGVIEKTKKTRLKNAYQYLSDADWLTNRHYESNKSIRQIANELAVCYNTVVNAFKTHNIPIKKSRVIQSVLDKLTNYEWMYNQHITNKKTLVDIANDLEVQHDTVRKYANLLDLPVVLHSTLPTNTFNNLNDYSWLFDQCITNKKNYAHLAAELGICAITVKEYCDYHGIIPSSKNRKLSSGLLLKLEDAQWLDYQHNVLKKSQLQIATELGFCTHSPTNSSTVSAQMTKHNIQTQRFGYSMAEKEVFDYIQNIAPNIIHNDRSLIPPYELDIYLPEHKLAVEYNGLYWHSEQQGKDKHYHKRKHDMCHEKGIQLITIFEDEWIHRKNQVEMKLSSMLGCDNRSTIYARKCDIILVTSALKSKFFDDNHIQGNGPGSINIGLTHKGELIACMSFIKQHDKHYLNRYATSKRVPGGFSKLLNHFKTSYEWNKIISFADNRWSNGNLYEQTKWTLDKTIPPDYSYVKQDNRIHKFNYRRKHLPNILDHFDPDLSEWENCKANGILRIWDCGKLKYILYNEHNDE